MARISDFNFKEGKKIASKYKIVARIGKGWEGEVYIVREITTGIERAAKFFFPQRNTGNKTAKIYAKKLHKLRNCSSLIRYMTQEVIDFEGEAITILVSEFVEGEPLGTFLNSQPGKRLSYFQGLHLLHALAKGLEEVHNIKEYHGDLHIDNIILKKKGLGFELKLIDLFHWGKTSSINYKDDICDLIRVFYDIIGGAKHYKTMPAPVKDICCGLKRNLILKKFKTMNALIVHLENIDWE